MWRVSLEDSAERTVQARPGPGHLGTARTGYRTHVRGYVASLSSTAGKGGAQIPQTRFLPSDTGDLKEKVP